MGSNLKTFNDIKNSVWSSKESKLDLTTGETFWDYEKNPRIDDVNLWEELYYVPATVGIYAAYDPYIEYYIIVYNLFIDQDAGLEEFYGPGANKKIWEKAKVLGIELPTATMWISKKDSWLYESLD